MRFAPLIVALLLPASAEAQPIPPPPPVSVLELQDNCVDHVFRPAPTGFEVSHSQSQAGDPVNLQLEIFPGRITEGFPLVRTSAWQPDMGTSTVIPIDPDLLMENEEHTIRVRAVELGRVSDWTGCTFWVDAINEPPGLPVITEPLPQTTYPSELQTLLVYVSGVLDPEQAIPGSTLELAYCATVDTLPGACDLEPALWPRTVARSDGTSTIGLRTTQDGALLAPRSVLQIRVRGIDEEDLVGPVAQVRTLISGEGVQGDCGARPAVCDPGTYCDLNFNWCEECPVCYVGERCVDWGCPAQALPRNVPEPLSGGGCHCSSEGSADPSVAWLLLAGLAAALLRRRPVCP